MKTTSLGLVAPAALVLAIGCGTAAATNELVAARSAYEQARNSEAVELNPTGVHDAYKALQIAEAAHKDDAGSDKEKHYAYVATRKAERAVTDASGALAVSEQQRAKQGYQQALERRASEVAAQSSQYAEQLTDTQRALQQNSQQLQQSREQLAATQQAARAAQDQLRKSESLREEAGRMIIRLSGGVMFESGGSELSQAARQRLDTVANALSAYPEREITVAGHTDSQGNDEFNRALSEKRAQAVRSYLVSRGVPEARIRAVGRGEAEPIATNDTAEGRASNRRVEIVVEPERPGQVPAALPAHDVRSPDTPASPDAPTGASEGRRPMPSSDTPAQTPPSTAR
jgi:outer membrane protein OmpA-like peptidoglycan-associated protein